MNLDTAKLMECVDWEGITDDKVTINVDGEKQVLNLIIITMMIWLEIYVLMM